MRVAMRRRLVAPPSPECREDEGATATASLFRVDMPPLRRVVISSSELSSSYLLFFTLVRFLHRRVDSQSS